MKVNIGPYIDWYSPYQFFEMFKKIGVKEDTIDMFIEKTPQWVYNICEWIYAKRQRRIKVKIHPYDTWSMDSTLAIIILPLLKQLKATKHGSPHLQVFDQTSNSNQKCFDFYKDGDEEADKEGHNQWEKILDEMIWAFEQIQYDNDWEAQYIKNRDSQKPIYDWDGMRKHQERITSALMMFGKYFEALWD